MLSQFSPPVRAWFADTFGDPTPPQALGWPAIQRGEHTLILAPTGSGKTLSAFLWGIDDLFRELTGMDVLDAPSPAMVARDGDVATPPGVRLVYISPLKALNNDIQRNLRIPLAGVRAAATAAGLEWPEIRVAVRSGDTPQRERRALLTRPPHILITTPESLYLLLTSPRAREIFAPVRTVIVDEIHTLAGNKRGVHLSVSLERLQDLTASPIQRIGLSATIRPLEEVARFLAGAEWVPDGDGSGGARDEGCADVPAEPGAHPHRGLVARPVTIVDAGHQKPLDLRVETLTEDYRGLPGGSVWPVLIPRVLDLIRQHRTTLVFTNNRRLAERTADRLNEQAAAEARGEASELPPFRAHHGSMARDARLEMERDLKAGTTRALVGTSSLELGIDIGTVDLVVQLQSPSSVAQGLQRVGRSGHMVGQTSKGRIFPTHREDLLQAAVVARGMLAGDVEAVVTPLNPLDVLAQQVVAAVAVEDWRVDDLFRLVRRAYAYRDLTPRAFRAVLDMVSGRFPSSAHRELRPRVGWDRVNDRLTALPGSRLLALTNGGTIPNRGLFGAYLSDGKTRIGELDEEFVFESRAGDTFILGSQVWRILEITDDRVLVGEAPGALPRMPFWHGDMPWRPYELGKRVGEFRRTLAERLQRMASELATAREAGDGSPDPGVVVDAPVADDPRWADAPVADDTSPAARPRRRDVATRPTSLSLLLDEEWDHPRLREELSWLARTCALDGPSARQTLRYMASQLDRGGEVATDRTVVVEVFDDAIGDPRMVVHSVFGGRVNGAWGMILAGALRERTGVEVEMQAGDDGILMRFPDADAEFPLDLIADIGPAEARRRLLVELPDSAVFGAQFRMNAARALLLPGLRGGKRTPFWLQRLRARDLLQVVRRYPDFPLLAETYRDCLEDVMDVPALEEVLAAVEKGEIRVVTSESLVPSPVAQSLLRQFTDTHLYGTDAPKAERNLQAMAVNPELLQDLLRDVRLDEVLKPEALVEVEARLQRTAPDGRARTVEELALLVEELGDLSSAEVVARCVVAPGPWLADLEARGRIERIEIPTSAGIEERWIWGEWKDDYRRALGVDAAPDVAFSDHGAPPARDAMRRILERHLARSGPVTLEQLGRRYGFPAEALQDELDEMVGTRRLAEGRFSPKPKTASSTGDATPAHVEPAELPPTEYVDVHVLEQLHRHTLGALRREVRSVDLITYADFLVDWQHLSSDQRLGGEGGMRQILAQLRAAPVVGSVWERDVLPLRLWGFEPALLESLCRSGDLVWIVSGEKDPRRARVRFLFRGEGAAFVGAAEGGVAELTPPAVAVHDLLRTEGALFTADLRGGLALDERALESALVELVMAGFVTNDSLSALRHLADWAPVAPGTGRGAASSLEVDLARRLEGRGLGAGTTRRLSGRLSGSASYPGVRPHGLQRPARGVQRAASRRVRDRLALRGPAPSGAAQDDLPTDGRWGLVDRLGVMGPPLPPDERSLRQARQLLLRHGVVTRACLDREEGPWEWTAIYRQLLRMELRAEVRRGYFVRGLPGVQFALPEAVEHLRAVSGRGCVVVMNACDPANIWGPAAMGSDAAVAVAASSGASTAEASRSPLTFARVPTTWLVQHRGLPLLVAEDTAARIRVAPGVGDGLVGAALAALVDHLSTFAATLTVESWDGVRVLDSGAAALLESLGFYPDHPGMTWERR